MPCSLSLSLPVPASEEMGILLSETCRGHSWVVQQAVIPSLGKAIRASHCPFPAKLLGQKASRRPSVHCPQAAAPNPTQVGSNPFSALSATKF